jgi:regulator of protease activity HflC (stomatin/prohibitin superfamily)
MQFPSQKIITKDNVSIDIAAVAYYRISDSEKAVIVIENVYNAITQISQNTVRNVVSRFSLDQLLADTASINASHPPNDGGNRDRKELNHHLPRAIHDDGAGGS